MPEEETALLTEMLKSSTTYLEYGAGGSTVLAHKMGVKNIYSVESNKRFLNGIINIAKFTSVYVDIGPTKGLGYPLDESKKESWPDYTTKVWKIMKESPDLILIDGRFRVSCLLHSMKSAKNGTIILMDDYRKRQHYHVIDPVKVVGRMGVFIVKNQELPDNTYFYDPR